MKNLSFVLMLVIMTMLGLFSVSCVEEADNSSASSEMKDFARKLNLKIYCNNKFEDYCPATTGHGVPVNVKCISNGCYFVMPPK